MSNNTFAFIQAYVNAAPALHGIYVLYYGNELIYIGRAMGAGVTIRSRLQSHLNGNEGKCTQGASHFLTEVCSNPAQREADLLAWYKQANGRLPRCNERIG